MWFEHILLKGHGMKIKSMMISDPITVTIRATVQDAIELMKKNSIRHLPVVNNKKEIKGLLTLSDLKQALLPSMLGDLTLADMMIQNPISVSPEDDVEFAARLIYKYKIGGLPVVRDRQLVGIITESDILRAFIDMMGILFNSTRLDVATGTEPGQLNKAIRIINDHGGDIINVGMTAQRSTKRTYLFRLTPCDIKPIKLALEEKGFAVTAETA
jgi:acetoin utilization protein AcuB